MINFSEILKRESKQKSSILIYLSFWIRPKLFNKRIDSIYLRPGKRFNLFNQHINIYHILICRPTMFLHSLTMNDKNRPGASKSPLYLATIERAKEE